ncbi:Crp/Fnr family transcriptional regulator [Magnetococcales bacterium HHB-1]
MLAKDLMVEMRGLPFFEAFTDKELDFLSQEKQFFCEYPLGAFLLNSGAAERSFMVVIKGTVGIVKDQKTKNTPFAILDAGTVFGETAFFEPNVRASSVIAESFVTVFCLTCEQFDALPPPIANKLLTRIVHSLLKRLKKMNQAVVTLTRHLKQSGGKGQSLLSEL